MSIRSPASKAVPVPKVTVELAVPLITRVVYLSEVATVRVVAVELVRVISFERYRFTSAAARTSPAVKVFLGIGFLLFSF
jgi:hypothetical protein